MPTPLDDPRERLILPALRPFYDYFAKPFAWTALRLAVGVMLVIEGWPKIMAPFAQAGFLEGAGFWPGWFWSPFLAVLQVAGGALIAIGLFTRPVALAATVMLLATLWFHVSNPYGAAFLTPEGIAFLSGEGAQYLTADGQRRLAADGGAGFLAQVQSKAEFASLFWAGACGIFAAFGGGYLSVDRYFLRREF